MKSDSLQHLRTISIAAVSSIPVVGGPLSVLMDKYLPDFLERRRTQLLDQLSAELTAIEGRLRPENLLSDSFAAVFLQCVRRSMEESHEEKLRAFRSIIMNTALQKPSTYDEVAFFVRLTSDLNVDQIRILRLVAEAPEALDEDSVLKAVWKLWPDADIDYVQACVTELIRLNLISSSVKHHKQAGSPRCPHVLTPFGRKFLAFITPPTVVENANSNS